MRLNKFSPAKAAPDPTGSGSYMTFISGHVEKTVADYDLYLSQGIVYVCRGSHIAIHAPAGICFVSGEDGKRIAQDFAKKWPRPKAPDTSPSSDS